MSKEILLSNIDKLHVTELGALRIKKNLKLSIWDVVEYLVKYYGKVAVRDNLVASIAAAK